MARDASNVHFLGEHAVGANLSADSEDGANAALGLSTYRSIFSQAAGTVEVEDKPGDGAVFRVLLPR